jgi:hypothetical protein
MPFVTYGRNIPNHGSRHERISERAYFKWLAAAQPGGRDLEFWFAAEDEESRRRESESIAAPASIRASLAGATGENGGR